MKMGCMTWVLLLAILLTTVLTAFPVLAETESGLKNVALGAKYESDAPYVLDADKHTDNYRNKNYTELTDGKKGTSTVGPEWYAYSGKNSYTITVDLGKTTDDLARVAVQFGKMESYAIHLPSAVAISGSADGKTYTELGNAKDLLPAGSTDVNHDYVLDLADGSAYRYIRVTITPNGFFTFVSEVEVLSGYISDFSITSGNAFVEGDTIRGLDEKTSVSDFLSMLNTVSGVVVKDSSGDEKTKGNLATGDIVAKRDANGKYDEYTVIIDGDLNGNGEVEARDYMMIKRDVLGTYGLKALEAAAADVNLDDAVDARDYIEVKRHVLGTYDIFDKYIPEPEKDGRGDVTAEFEDMDTTDNIETLQSYDMTLTRTANTTYSVTCQTDAGKLLLTIYRTAWGTYNLGKWELTEKSGTVQTFISGATDWEYVYRVSSSANENWQWSGGNHDNEQMRSLAFYNGETGALIELSVGQSVNITNLKVVEETSLYWGDAADGYSEDEHYADAVRTYTIVGPQIRLAVDYEYVKDAYYSISYTCMFPINKKYGLYCAFLDGEELLSVVETFKVGKADYSGKQHDGNASDRCIMWGYDGMEKYKFDVRVLTPETSCNNFDNDMKVSFWDMNTGSNKLYFSKYDGDMPFEKVASGSTVHTECQWTFYME